jgi:uncharacterized SAM-binding protein YcdF (DUF218 family)
MKSLIRRQLLLNKDAKPGAFVLEEKLDAANHLVWVIGISNISQFILDYFCLLHAQFLLFTANSKAQLCPTRVQLHLAFT